MESECPICLIGINNNYNNYITLSCCKNKLHTICFLQCMDVKKECPLCRNKIPSEEHTVLTIMEDQQNAVIDNVDIMKGLKKCLCVTFFLTLFSLLGVIIYERQ